MKDNSTAGLTDIRRTYVFNATIHKVWEAVATSEGMAAWFMPNNFQPIVEYEFHLDAGPWGKSLCKVTEVDPPHRLSFKWGEDWTLTFELVDLNGKTQFTLIHSGWDAEKVTAFGEPHSIVRDRMNQGWGKLGESLRQAVENGYGQ